MSDFVTDDDLSALAGEYVLGTLDPTERNRANVLLDVDQRFRGLVRVWERRFGELHLMVEPVAPDPKIWQRIGGKLGIGPAEPALAPAPAIARVEAPAVAKADVIKPEMATPAVNAKAIEPEPEPAQVAVAGIEGDVLELGEARPERQLADLIQEVEKYTETMKGGLGGLPPSAPATADASTPKLEVKSEFELDLELEPEPEPEPEPELRSEPEAKPDSEPQTEAREPDLAEEREPDLAEEREPDHAEQREAANGREAAKEKERAPLDATAAALVAVEQAREHLRRMQERPPRVGRWRAVALLMTFVAAGLSGLIAAWRFAPAHLPEPLRPMAVLNIPEGQAPGERAPVEHGTQFEE